MKKLVILVLVGMGFLNQANARQDAQYTQYMYNTMSINPAFAGSRGVLSINALHRSQWVGLDGASTSETLNLHAPVSESVDLGLSAVNDEIGNGTTQETAFNAVFSYTIPTGNDGKLSFGLQAGGNLLNINFATLLQVLQVQQPKWQARIFRLISGQALLPHTNFLRRFINP